MKKIAYTRQNIDSYAPVKSGVYFLFDDDDRVLYIGKSKNIKRRLVEHFTGVSHLESDTHSFTFSLCSEKVMDEIESIMISNLEPPINIKKKSELTGLKGIYFEPNVLKMLDILVKETGLSRSRIVNDLVTLKFCEAGLLDEKDVNIQGTLDKINDYTNRRRKK